MSYINQSIFRAYDVRGRESADELNVDALQLLGKAYGTYLAKRNIGTVVIGHDSRSTSDDFHEAAIAGLRSTGRQVIDLGIILTPMMYWAQYRFKTAGGMMITASHNPVGWNGAKFASGLSETLGGEDLMKFYEMIRAEDFFESKEISVRKEDIKEAYTQDLVGRVPIKRRFKIVVNTGNGTAGLFVPDLLREAGAEVIEHNTNLDPSYPNYTPNPAELEMMEDTARLVREHKADLGFAFDGDGDRVGLVDEKGNIVWPDRYMIFLARLVLQNVPGAKIIYDVKSSQALQEDIQAHGGVAIMAATGHSKIKAAMQKEGAELAGELSGHMFFKYNYYGFDDASFAALNLLHYFSQEDKSVSALVAETPAYFSTPGYYAEVPDDKKVQVVDELREEFKKEGYKVIDIDGAKVMFEHGWGLVRVSNTTPAITLRFEAKSQEELDKIEGIFREKLERFKEVSQEWKAA